MLRLLALVLLMTINGVHAASNAATPAILSGTENLSSKHQQKFQLWVDNTLQYVENTLGSLPQSQLPIQLKTKLFTTEPVPWGQVERDYNGINDGLYLVVNRLAPPSQLAYDWTLFHEISHLYLPYLDYRSFWLSEGFATYMQNVVMLENQVFDRDEFIARMKSGLKRGKENTFRAKGNLSAVTNDMRKYRAFKRVYWSGTAYFIEADITLQKHGKSLVDVIARFSHCCKNKVNTGRQLAKTLDRMTGQNIFLPLFLEYKDRRDFPTIDNSHIYQLAHFYRPNTLLDIKTNQKEMGTSSPE